MTRYAWWENTVTTHSDIRQAWISALNRTVDVDEDTGAPGALSWVRVAGLDKSVVACSASMAQLPMRTNPRGWELVARPTLESRRTAGFLREVFDTAEEMLPGRAQRIMLHIMGPWSFGASVEYAGHALLSDRPAFKDCALSLGEGVRAYCSAINAAIGAEVTVVLHEPRVAEVLQGMPGATDFARIPPVDREHVHGVWERFITHVGCPVIIDCEGSWPEEVDPGSSTRIVIPVQQTESKAGKDTVGALLNYGVRIGLSGAGEPEEMARHVMRLWKEWTFDGADLLAQVDLVVPEAQRTPAQASMDAVRVRRAASLLWQD